MALTNDQITAQNFKDFYDQIRPYLNGQVPTFANQFSRSDLYSTDEKIIGQWIDSKPLYQKTYQTADNITGNNIIVADNLGSMNIDNVVFAECFKVRKSDHNIFDVPNNYIAENGTVSNVAFQLLANRTKILVRQHNDYASEAGQFYVTTRYTKTTDSAIKVGTGTDYSTEEQVIGTWIDSKPLYQKTISTNISEFSGSGSTRYYDVSSLSIDKPFGIVSGMANVNGTWYSYPDIELSGTGFNLSYSFSMTLRNSATNGFILWMQDTVASRISDVIFTIRYTKTTD